MHPILAQRRGPIVYHTLWISLGLIAAVLLYRLGGIPLVTSLMLSVPLALIWTAIDRLQEFPDLGMRTEDAEIRQIVVRFGSSGYIVRYAALPGDGNILITRIWHGREART